MFEIYMINFAHEYMAIGIFRNGTKLFRSAKYQYPSNHEIKWDEE